MKIGRLKTCKRGIAAASSAPDCVLHAAGDMTSCEQVRRLFNHCRRAIGERHDGLVIDLKNVTRLDTKLMACLVAVYRQAAASKVRLELLCPASVLSMAEVCRLNWLIERTAPAKA